MRCWIHILMISMVLTGLCACDQLREEPPPPGRILVNFWHGMSGPLGIVLSNMIDEYNSSQQTYFVRAVNMGSYDTLQKKILASVVAGRSPDISQNYEALTLKLSRAGKLVCLDDLIALEPDPEGFIADIILVMLRNNTYDGKLWSFPFNKSVPVLYYNKEMFREAGLDPDVPPKTAEDMREYCRRLTRDTTGDGKADIFGYATTIRNEWNWSGLFRSSGGTLFDPVSRKVFLNTEAGYYATSFYYNLIRDGVAKFAEGFDHQNDWLAGKIAMFEASIVTRVFLKGKINFDYGVAPVPSGAVRPAVVLSGTNINIFDNGDPEKIAGAWDFVKWFTGSENGARWSLETAYMPVRQSSLKTDTIRKMFDQDPNFAAPYVQLDYAEFDPRIPEWFECRIKISDELEQLYIKAAAQRDAGTRSDQDLVELHLKRMQENVEYVSENSLDAQL